MKTVTLFLWVILEPPLTYLSAAKKGLNVGRFLREHADQMNAEEDQKIQCWINRICRLEMSLIWCFRKRSATKIQRWVKRVSRIDIHKDPEPFKVVQRTPATIVVENHVALKTQQRNKVVKRREKKYKPKGNTRRRKQRQRQNPGFNQSWGAPSLKIIETVLPPGLTKIETRRRTRRRDKKVQLNSEWGGECFDPEGCYSDIDYWMVYGDNLFGDGLYDYSEYESDYTYYNDDYDDYYDDNDHYEFDSDFDGEYECSGHCDCANCR